jgi:hypothetical protein
MAVEEAAAEEAAADEAAADEHAVSLMAADEAAAAEEGTQPETLDIPPGSWAEHCIEASDSGTFLCARCRRCNGQFPPPGTFSCLDWAGCGAVNNCDGHLQCSPDCSC